jgi:hypothetical protein
MRYVELRRHTDNDGDKLSEKGVADAEAIGKTGLHPPYAAFVSTGAERDPVDAAGSGSGAVPVRDVRRRSLWISRPQRRSQRQ